MEFFPKTLSEDESYQLGGMIKSLINENGWGFWAVELLDSGEFIGFVGLHSPKDTFPFSPCVEIGWRLDHQYWGKGYACEAAHKALTFAFTDLNLDEIVSFTTKENKRSQRVMQKLGMTNTQSNFAHPDLPSDHEQSEHVLYKLTKRDWLEAQS